MVSTSAFCFCVLIGMKGIHSHARSIETTQYILRSSCIAVKIADPNVVDDPDDERELFVAAWCAHLDLILYKIIIAIPEPEPKHDGGSPPYPHPWEIIHDEVLMRRYFVQICLVEFQDWHMPPPLLNGYLVVLITPKAGDLNYLREILYLFAKASALMMNVDKCVLAPIRCTEEMVVVT